MAYDPYADLNTPDQMAARLAGLQNGTIPTPVISYGMAPTAQQRTTQPDYSKLVAPDRTTDMGINESGYQTPGGTGTNLASFTAGMTPDQVRALANQYIAAGGVQNIDNGQYWVDKYAEMNDPGYLQMRLIQGIGDQPGYNGAFGNVSTPSGNLPSSGGSLYTPNTAEVPTAQAAPYQAPSGGSTSSDMDAYYASQGWVKLPTGEWVPPDHPLAQTAGAQPGGTSSTGTPSPVPPGPSQESAQSASQNLLDTLVNRAMGTSTDVNPNDPIIRGQVDAYDAKQQQGVRDQMRAAAEKAGVYGSTNLGAESRAANEQAAQNTSGFQATLMSNELQARRTEIQNALTSLQGYLTDQQRLQLQKSLSDLDRALEYARLQEQGSEFGASLGEQNSEFNARMQEMANELAQRAYEFDTSQANGVFL